MPPRSRRDASSAAEGRKIPLCTTSLQGQGDSATSLLIKLLRDSAPTSRNKSKRIMLDKSVSTTEDNQMRESSSTTPSGVPRAEPPIPISIAFSKSSHFTENEELETQMLQVTEEAEECELNRQTVLSEDRFTTTLVNNPFSSIPGFVRDGSTKPLPETEADLMRCGSAQISAAEQNDDSERNMEARSSLPSEGQVHISTYRSTRDHAHRSPMTVSAAQRGEIRRDRPIPRNMRDPGHSAPTTSAMDITVSNAGAVQSHILLRNQRITQPEDVTRGQVNEVQDWTKLSQINTETRNGSTSRWTEQDLLTDAATRWYPDEDRGSPIIIAHNKEKQQLLDDKGVAKGVQFEIARGITHGWWTWDDITYAVAEQLSGSNFEKAGKVGQIINKGPKERAASGTDLNTQAIYAELDREQEAFAKHGDRGLGLKGPWEGKDNWYGGRVQLTAKLEFNKNCPGNPPFSIRLNGFRTGKSNRAARMFTSLSILQLKFEKEALFEEKNYKLVTELLSKHAVICGRLYCAFCTKEGKIFFVETKEDYQRKARESDGDQYRVSYEELVKTINPLGLNKGQAMNKWLARWQLILSTSRPVIEFQPENIYLDLEDIYGVESDKESIMTDGCGWMNYTALQQIAIATNSNFPVVVQGRIGGAKGLWLLHPADEHRSPDEPPKIWIRKSQNKIRLPPKHTWHRCLRIFDLVRLPRLSVPSGLNGQTILNMSDNGVEDDAFVRLMEAGLKAEIEPLSKWEGKNACILLAKAVEEAGRVMNARRTRAFGGEARLYSCIRDEVDEDVDGDEDDDSGIIGFLAARDSISGYPVSLYENVRDLLLAGFTPSQNPVLRDKLKFVLKQVIKYRVEKFHIPVAFSAEAFIAPDPYGVLEEGEIYFNCSAVVGDATTCIDPHTFSGPVLVSRNPTMVPSDVRKVTAVSRDQLLKYKDVIIFSTKGKRSLASYLGGGDYDGDTATIIAEPSIVNAFHNAEIVLEPESVREAFEVEVEKVSEFLVAMKSVSRQELSGEISRRVLRGLSDGKVGKYSKFHDNAVYELGYHNPETIRLAFMFTTCLDAVKSGLRIKGAVFQKDLNKWNVPRPDCMQKADERARDQDKGEFVRQLARPPNSKPFVLETLQARSRGLADKALSDFEALSIQRTYYGLREKPDEDLTRPYLEMKSFATHLRDAYKVNGPLEDLGKVEVFVRSLCEEYIRATVSLYGKEDNGDERSSKAIPMAKINHEFATRFQTGPRDCYVHVHIPMLTLNEVKASYAYDYGMTRSKSGYRFGFAVAHDTLCALKVRAKGGASVCRDCRDFTTISSNLVKLARDD